MYRRRSKEPPITVLDRKDITAYVRAFVLHARNTRGRVYNLRHFQEARNMIEDINNPANTTFKSTRDFRDGSYFWHEQRVDFVPSNLGHGHIFYFRCNGCGYRVKYLYEYSIMKTPLCRVCCRLRYRQPARKERKLSKLMHKPYLSSEDRYALIKRAGITAEDVRAALI